MLPIPPPRPIEVVEPGPITLGVETIPPVGPIPPPSIEPMELVVPLKKTSVICKSSETIMVSNTFFSRLTLSSLI
jgi:hypothetical protein